MHKQLFFWAAFIWTGIIAFFCLVQFRSVPLGSVSNLDKLVHAFFHLVLTSLWYLFFRASLIKSNSFKSLIASFLFSFFFGIGIEIAQEMFTKTRHADVLDVVANALGATISVVLILLFDTKLNRR